MLSHSFNNVNGPQVLKSGRPASNHPIQVTDISVDLESQVKTKAADQEIELEEPANPRSKSTTNQKRGRRANGR